jgi:hypothetical protein
MPARRDRPLRVTAELLAFHRTNAWRLRQAARREAWRRIGGWLAKLRRRR